MSYKKIFDEFNEFTESYLIVRGMCDLVKMENGNYRFSEFNDDCIYEATGNYDEDLIRESFNYYDDLKIECEGLYKFQALLTHEKAQIGDYPPPNIELPEHYCIDYIEFELEISKDDMDNMPNVNCDGLGVEF